MWKNMKTAVKKSLKNPKKGKGKKKVEKKDLESKNLDDFLQDWNSDEEENSDNDENESKSDDEETSASDQKKYLSSLKDKDPEFFEFLQENDQELLNFDDSSDDDKEELDPIHQLPDKLEVDSDDSDYEESDEEIEEKGAEKLTKKTIEEWSNKLEKSPNVQLISKVVSAFKSSLVNISEEKGGKAALKVSNGPVFNALMRLLITKLEPALQNLLKAKKLADLQHCKNWRPLNKWLKSYTNDLCKYMTAISEVSVISAILKHIHGLVLYFAALPKSAKVLCKNLISLWSTHNEESVRVLAFMAIVRLTRTTLNSEHGSLLEMVMKNMYMAYIRNSKFTSPNTWPMIHFMRRSLAEIFLLDTGLAYKHAFIYIRQLTIHLRNAMMNNSSEKKKENPLQTVYNWQFVHSINLWVQILSDSESEVLQPLIYPLVQLMNGTIRLNYTSKYYPLRFHLSQLLTQLADQTGKFIPVLPYYLDILTQSKFSVKKNGPKLSMKPMDFSCILRLSKSQLGESGFKDATIEQIYYGLLQNLAFSSHKICFPELAIPALAQLRNFAKNCKVTNYTKKMKTVKDKIEENAKFIQDQRSKVTFGVKDLAEIATFETHLRAKGTPLMKFFETLKAIKEAEKAKKVKKEFDDYKHIPEYKPSKKKEVSEFKGIFGDENSDEDEMGDEERFELKEDRKRKKKKEKKVEEPKPKKAKKVQQKKEESEDEDDVVQDFDDFSD